MSLVSLKEFRDDHDFTEVYYAEEHQRREVWNNQLLALFMVSVCRGWSQLTTIVVADVKKCLKFSRKNGDRVSTKYFQRILIKMAIWKDHLISQYGYRSQSGYQVHREHQVLAKLEVYFELHYSNNRPLGTCVGRLGASLCTH